MTRIYRKFKKMKWTRKPPMEPGWYYYKNAADPIGRVVYVLGRDKDNGKVLLGPKYKIIINKGSWAGPLSTADNDAPAYR